MRRPVVTLTTHELMRAVIIGVQRNVSAIERNATPSHGRDKALAAWNENIEGAAGELAVAKYFGVADEWNGNFGDFQAADVRDLEVRTTSWQTGRLIIHPSDPGARRFLLVVGTAPTFKLVGWMMGATAKREEWWVELQSGRPAYGVPQSALYELPER